ncbi:conserved exported hypothetical protein [Flavobacterium sp. 9R]|uniref:hypothetical protein n=1 Tax=Flavobacterium sp. 9R TaxID=2653143 RepID=UPI0012F35612|nr:hypothetical protein [Flavobacterium sp. 9R]VXB93842.1 conserved exported hypothetical protein [Flavobacterium sp. 9R]
MKLYLVLFLLLSSLVTFSQSDDKDVLNLLDSIKAIDPVESLNSQVNQLTYEIGKAQGDLRNLTQEYKMLEEFCVRQYLYRKIVDQLEFGVTPDTSELDPFITSKMRNVWLVDDWSLIEIPPTGTNFPITIFIDSSNDMNPYFNDFPVKDFGLSMYNGDAILKKAYPNIFKKIKSGKIVFKFKQLAPMFLQFMGVPKLQFPSDLSNTKKKSLESKQKYADELLDWISSALSGAMKSVGYTSDVLGDYMKIEKKAYTKPTIDEKITLRIQYIQFLKKKYDMVWK